MLRILAIALLGIAALAAIALLPQAAMASTPPGPCEDGYVAPTPVSVTVTGVPIEVASTTSDYFVLYAKHTLNGTTSEIPVSVTRGADGTTTLSDNLEPLAADQYRVEKYQVATPADMDGDCVDDITELDDLGAYNPINSAKKISPVHGVVAIDSHAAFQELAFRGVSHESHLDGIGFVKFWILDPYSDSPEVFFMNTKKYVYHNPFVTAIGYTTEDMAGAMAGQLVWHPNVPAPDGTLGSYRFEWGAFAARTFAGTERVYMTLAAAMPFLEDNLYFYPETTPYFSSYWDEREKFDASRIHILLERQVLPDVDYIALNEAEGYGRLRLMEDDDRPSPYDVAIYTSLPNDLPRVAGTITTVPQTPLSHVNLRAIQNNLPNAFIRDVLKDEAIKPLIGKYVYYAVTGEGYTIREATKTEVDAHHNKLRPQSVQTLQSDLTVTEITALADVEFADWTAFGVKAANVAELTQLSLPDGTTPVGFAVPFYFYDEFMKQATVAEETILGKKKAPDEEKITLAAGTTLASAVTQMLAHSYFQTDADIQEEMLDDLRDAIKDAASPKFITDALTAMHAKYPDGQSLRYRSSTNNEDLPSFNGAGLYSSKTQDPDETTDDGIDKSIKGVWASLWNYRAFLERDFHRVDHTAVYMGVLVHPNYSDELVNGVAVSYDPITLQDNAYYVNSQVGEDLVTNPEAYSMPEQLLLGATGAATVLSRSNLAPSDRLLMTDAQMRQLRSNMETIHDHFKTLYGVQDGDDYAIEIEFKITAENRLAIKQARPWIFAEPLELTPTVTIALSSAQATEGAGLELTATRSGGVLSTPLTIDLTWSETGAMLKKAKPASVTIPVNQTTTTINAPIDDDQEDEHDSVVTSSIATDSKYVIGTPGSASATVTDDDLPQIAVRADAGTVTEGATADFTFTRSGSVLEQPLTVDITVTETGGRLTGVLPTQATFAANSATTSVSLLTADDEAITNQSLVTVQIDAGSAYGIAGAGSARVTVQDDEILGPTLLFATDHAVSEGKAHVVPLHTRGSRIGDLTFAMAGADTGAFTLYEDSGLLLFTEHDYAPPGDADQDGVYEIDFTAERSQDDRRGSTTARLRFTVTNAELIALAEQQWDQTTPEQRAMLLPEEANSRLQPAFASLSADVQAMALRLARQQQLPSPGPAISIIAGSDITEGDNATFTVSASPAPASALSVSVSVAQTGDFGVTPGSQTVTIPTTGSYTLTVATVNDSVDEANGSIMATVSRGNGYLVSWAAGAATVAVADDDVAPHSTTPEISIIGGSGITEGGNAVFTIAANPAPNAPLDVSVSVSQTGDFGVATGSQAVSIPTTGSATLTVATVNDGVDEADGSVTTTVSSGTGYTVSATAGSATVAVADDDVPEISIASDGDITEGGDASFTVSANPAPAADLDVSVSVTQSGDFGVTPGSQTVSIPTSGSYTLTVATVNDGVDEADGSVTVTVSSGTGYTVSATAGSATVAVADDDDPPPATPEVSITGGSGITEGGNASFTVTANPAPNAPLDVSVSVAQSGDFGVTPGSQTVSIPTSGSYTLTVATVNDGVDEADGSVTANVNTGAGYSVSSTAGLATVAVADDDAAPQTCTPNLPSDAITVSEVKTWRGEYSHDEHVSRWNRVLAALGEDTGETAMTAEDARAIKQQFDNTRWDRTVRTLEAMEQCADSTDTTQTVTPEISITGGSGITEGGNASFTVTANPAPNAPLSVSVAISETGDYGVSTGTQTVSIPTTGSYTLTVATGDDGVDEADGSVTATVNTGTGYTVSATAGVATVAVADDDDTAAISCTPNLPSDAITVSEVETWRGEYSHDEHVSRWNRVLAALGEDTGETAMTAEDARTIKQQFDNTRWDRTVRTLEAMEQCAGSTDTTPAATPEVSIVSDGDITEGGDALFTVTANPAPAADLDVSVSVTQSGDYGVSTGSQTVSIPTSGSYTLIVATVNDNVDEADGSVTVTVNSGAGYTVSATTEAATVAVADDDDPPAATPEISITGGSGVTEGNNASFTVTANPAPASALSVSVAISQSGDFGVATGSQTVTIPTTGSATLTVATSDDNVDEADGSVTANVNTGAGYTVSATAGSAAVSVEDDDVPEISVTAGNGITEGGDASFTLTANPAPHAPLSVTVSVSQTGDYGATPGSHTVTIPATGSAALTVATVNDGVDEADGSVTATVDAGTGYTASATAGSATVAVADDDAAPQTCTPNLPSDAITVSEVKTWRGEYSHDEHVSRWNRVLAALGEDTGETAMTAEDARAIKQQFDNTRWDRTVRTLEAMEQCADSTDTTQTVTPEISITGGSGITEGGNASFTVTANPAPNAPLSVSVAISETGDYGVSTGTQTVSIPTTGSYTLTVATGDDGVDEADGSVTATVNTGTGYTVSATAGVATVAVADDDDTAAISCTPNLPSDAITVSEVETWRGEYSHDEHVSRWNRVLAALGEDTGETAMTAEDARTIKQQFDNTRWDRTVRTLEAMEQCAGSTDTTPAATPEVSIVSDGDITEGGDALFTVTANPAPAADLDVSVSVTQSGDYGVSTGSQTVSIPTSGSYTLIVATVNDNVDEADGSVTVTVNSGAGYTVSATTEAATVAVADDDDPPAATPEISITGGSGVTEGNNASFTVTANPAPASALSVSVAISQSGDFGVATGSQTVTIPTTGSATLTVATSDDNVDEADGSVTANVNTGAGYTVSATAGSAAVSVEDDDVPEISVTAGNGITEGGDASFTLTANPAPHAPLSVTVSVSQTGDYGATPGSHTVTIPATGSAALTVATVNDGVDEADGSVTATVDAGTGYTASATAGSATVAVADDDDPAPDATPSLSVSDGSAREDAGVMEFTVTLSAPSDKKVQVMAATTYFLYRTATVGDDFEEARFPLTFAPGETSKTVQVVILDDDLSEGDESFGLYLAYTPTFTPIAREHGEGVIVDDD